jgi:divalent metal cation (Fe/Co/Zn/Cd) transporter
VALFTIGGSYVFQDATWLDPVGGVLISLMVIKAGWNNTVTSLLELADTTVDDDIKSSVEKAAAKALQEIADGDAVVVRDVQGMKSGQNYLMDIELAVPGDWAITRSRLVEEAVRKAVGARVRGVKRVKMRFIPMEQQDLTFSEEFIAPDARGSPEPDANDSAEVSGSHLHHHVEENNTRKRH